MSFVRDALGRDYLNNQIEPISSKTSVRLDNRTHVYAAFVSSSRTVSEVASSTYDSFANPIADLPGGVVRCTYCLIIDSTIASRARCSIG
jgi:hypothetical protein